MNKYVKHSIQHAREGKRGRNHRELVKERSFKCKVWY